jgi:hypothetical protein
VRDECLNLEIEGQAMSGVHAQTILLVDWTITCGGMPPNKKPMPNSPKSQA